MVNFQNKKPSVSGQGGTDHWWAQRWTGMLLVLLTLWFMGAVTNLHNYENALSWGMKLHNGALLMLLLGTALYHAALGIQVIIEDYIHCERFKILALLLTKGISLGLGALGLFSLIKIISRTAL